MEQIKSSPEVKKKIIAAAKAARKSPSYPSELNNDIYSKEQGLVMADFGHFKDDHVLANGGKFSNHDPMNLFQNNHYFFFSGSRR